jgi:hypothetical protein
LNCCYESINKRVIATFLSFGKLDSLFFSTAVLPKFSEFYFSVYFYFYLAIIILTSQYFMTLRSSSSVNLILLKFIESKISTNWIFIWDSMWLFLWVIFLPTYLDGLFYYSPNSANYSCSRLLNKTRGILKSSILADFIRISNNVFWRSLLVAKA